MAVCISCIAAGGPTLAQDQAKNFGDQAATLRLVGGSGLVSGHYDAGIDVTMRPGSHTYWKMPGDAGVPPVFAFNGSENVAAAEVLFPAPSRITEDGLDAFGYSDTVVFPVVVTPSDPSKPSVLNLSMMYAVCNRICIPVHGTATLTLATKAAASGDADALVTAALAKVPAPISTAEQANLAITPGSAPKPTWTVTWTGAQPIQDLFADAPEGYVFDTRKTGPSTWTLVASQTVATGSTTAVAVALTLTRHGGDHSLVATEKLDVSAPTR